MQLLQDFFVTIHTILVPQLSYNTRIVLLGVIFYSVGCGLIGNYMLLQKRSLLADVLSHATFPGIMTMFIFMLVIGSVYYSKSLLVLMLGAMISTFLALCLLVLLEKHTILKPDAIQSIILSVFFGVGIVLLGIAQRIPTGTVGGIMTYIYGNTASMQKSDAFLFVISSLLVFMFIIFKKRALTILCFDKGFSYSIGIRTNILDFVLLLLVLLQVAIGIQAIGILMVSAMLIIPVVVARFWSEKLNTLILVSVAVGVVSGYIGALLSANSANFPTGAVIVTVMELFFIFSLFFGKKKGIIIKYFEKRKFAQKIHMEHLFRVMYEYVEQHPDSVRSIIPLEYINTHQGHSGNHADWLLAKMEKREFLVRSSQKIELTPKGILASQKVLRNHRLWETYLVYYTDASPDTVDYSADKIEHVLGDELTQELETILAKTYKDKAIVAEILPSPHNMEYATMHKDDIR